MLNTLTDGLKTILLAGVGAVAITAEKAGEVINELVKKGEITVEQGKVLNEELKHNFKSKCKEAADSVSAACTEEGAAADDIARRLEALSPDDLEKVKAKLAELEQTAPEEE